MKCFECSKGGMVRKVVEMTAHVRGEELLVRTESMVCDCCGFQVLTDEQSDAYGIASADAYREKHHLLTTAQLRAVRGRLKMSFRAFAKYLRVSQASPKRWEAGLVQDEAMDELVRLKTDPRAARANLTGLTTRLGIESTGSPMHVILQMQRRQPTEHEWRESEVYASAEVPKFVPGQTQDTCYGV